MKPIITISVAAIPHNYKPRLGRLNQPQKKRWDTEIVTQSEKRQREFCASRELLNVCSESLLERYQVKALPIAEPLKHPYRLLSSSDNAHPFNLSHSRNWVAVAIGDVALNCDIGVDIQTLKPDLNADKARFFCTQSQIQQGLNSQNPELFFSQLWCQKEAYFKATQQDFTQKSFIDDDNLTSFTVNENTFISVYCNHAYTAQLQTIII